MEWTQSSRFSSQEYVENVAPCNSFAIDESGGGTLDDLEANVHAIKKLEDHVDAMFPGDHVA